MGCEVCLWLPELKVISNSLVSFCSTRPPRVSLRLLLLRKLLCKELLSIVSVFLVAADVQNKLSAGVVCGELMKLKLREGDDIVIES